MSKSLSFPFLFLALLTACSGAAGPVGSTAPANLDSSVGAAPVGVVQHASGPGAEEVVLGPGVADPTDFYGTMTCEFKCESTLDAKPEMKVRLNGRIYAKTITPGEHVLRVVEYFNDNSISQYQDLKADAEGQFSYLIEGSGDRTVAVFLVQLKDTNLLQQKPVSCAPEECIQEGAGNLLKAQGIKRGEGCYPLHNASPALCDISLHLKTIEGLHLPKN